MKDSKQMLKEVLFADAAANGRKSIRPRFCGDEVWKFQVWLRKLEYYTNLTGYKKKATTVHRIVAKVRYHNLSVKLGLSIPINVFEKGLSIVHFGTIVVSKQARVGMNCRIHEGVTIGATNGSNKGAKIGKNVFIGSGAKIIGDVEIADDVAIAANSVVVHSILEAGTTWGGIPAKKISSNNSSSNLRTAM